MKQSKLLQQLQRKENYIKNLPSQVSSPKPIFLEESTNLKAHRVETILADNRENTMAMVSGKTPLLGIVLTHLRKSRLRWLIGLKKI